MEATYNNWLVALSLVLATGASFIALSLAARIPHIHKSTLWYWLTGGAVSMGLGIWSMHFVGMLAFHLPIPLAYDIELTLLSIVLGIMASGFSLYVVRNGIKDNIALLVSALLMGSGIAGMHYTGMAALRMSPPIEYDPILFIASLLIAFAASFFALKLCFSAGERDLVKMLGLERLTASVIMGAAIAGMHYTGMTAAIFSPDAVCLVASSGISPGLMSVLVVLGVTIILIFTLLLLMVDLKLAEKERFMLETLRRHNARLKDQAEQLAEEMTREVEESARKDRLLAAIVEQSGVAICTTDLEGKITSWNRSAEEMFGYHEQEVMGQKTSILYPPDADEEYREARQRIERERGCEITGWRMRKGGELIHVQINISPLYDAAHERVGAVAVIRDVTERRKAEEQLKLWASVYEHSGEGILITDNNNITISVNQAFVDITGYEADEIIGRDPMILGSGQHSKEFYHELWRELLEEGIWQGEIWNRKKDGSIFPEWLTITTIKDSGGTIRNYIAIFSDITEQKEREAYIQHLAHHDPLTGLPNRNLLRDRVEQAILHARRHEDYVAVLFLDLDRFKHINDTMGHDVGDRLLKAVAGRLRSYVRESDTICRQGGDEFIVVLTDVDHPSTVVSIVEKILHGLSESYQLDEYEVIVTPSIGISLFPDDSQDIDELIGHADAAMYHAKDLGRGNYQFFTQALNEMVATRVVIEKELRNALLNDEFELYFQPQVTLDTESLSGVEALIRWNNPKLGMVPPDSFISLSEEIGLIYDIGEWVLRSACKVIKQWQVRYSEGIRVAINVSVKQLSRQGFADRVLEIVEECGIDPAYLEFEVTESALMVAIEHSIEVLEVFRKYGIKVAIDDFGSGYSSLNYLRRLPIDKLKIDRSFIGGLPEAADEREISNAIIAMGHGLHLKVIAEGVERVEQADYLKLLGCDEVQGYFYSRPLPQSEFERYYEDRFGVSLSEGVD